MVNLTRMDAGASEAGAGPLLLGSDVRFLVSVDHARDLPRDDGREVAFAGRSNAGKSSVLNALLGRRALARVSKTPGRTQLLVCFAAGDGARLVDLPGYGYAKAPEAVRRRWGPMVETYLKERRSLAGLVVVMDARRPYTPLDEQMLGWAAHAGIEVLVLLNKADKLGAAERARCLAASRRRHAGSSPGVESMLHSAVSGLGREQARARVESWLGLARPG